MLAAMLRRHLLTFITLTFIAAIACAAPALAQRVYYADAGAAPGGNGENWASAFSSVQLALNTMANGDTLYTRGSFRETVVFPGNLNDVTWIGNSVPGNPTWMRGDIVPDPAEWQLSDASDEVIYTYLPASVPGFANGRPGGAVYDYKRDDAAGSVTGIPVIQPWYGHLIAASDLDDCVNTDGSWWYDAGSGATYINPPGLLDDADLSLIGLCVYDRNAVTMPGNHRVRISGVNTMLTPARVDNNGYGFKGNGQNNIIEHATIVDSGWHAAGFAINDSYRNTLSHLTAFGGSVPMSVNTNNPFVFYSSVNRADSQNVGIDLAFHAYPILRFDGRPLFDNFNPRLGLSHGAGSNFFGGIEWRRCLQVDYVNELRVKHDMTISWSGSFVSGSGFPSGTNEGYDPDLAPVRVYDSVVIGPSAKPHYGIAYFNTVFDRRGHAQEATGSVRGTGTIWLISCVLDPGQLRERADPYFKNLNAATRYFVDTSTIFISDPESLEGFLFDINQHCVALSLRSCLVSRVEPGPLIVSQPGSWQILPQIVSAGVSAFHNVPGPIAHSNPGVTPRSDAWWLASIDANARFDLVPEFVNAEALDLSPVPGSPIAVAFATPINDALLYRLVNGKAYAGRFGQVQTPIDPDVNGDGRTDIEDLYAAHAATASPTTTALRRLIAARLRDGEAAGIQH